jgi:Ni,Fe-hydrogenase III small subunit
MQFAYPYQLLPTFCKQLEEQGEIHAGSPALDRSFLNKYHVDLYIPGNPAHPLTIINGLLDLTRK